MIGSRILRYPELASTNDTARDLMEQGTEDGTVVVADHQTGGRGRRGRKWYSPPGTGLTASVVLYPHGCLGSFDMTTIAAVAVMEAVQDVVGLSPSVKWPNDIMLEEKKVAGILVEGIVRSNRVDKCVVGIGINVNQQLADFSDEIIKSASSLRLVSGKEQDRNKLLISLLKHFDTLYYRALEQGIHRIHDKWKSRLLWVGQNVVLSDETDEYQGILKGVDAEGNLLIEMKTGTTRAFISGDLTLRTTEKQALQPQEPT